MSINNLSWANFEGSDEYKLLITAAHELGYAGVPNLNDKAGHATVMTMFDRAIELAGEGQ